MKKRTIPFGYMLEKGEAISCKPEAKSLLMIFELYIKGRGYKAIAKRMNDSGIQYHPSADWNQNMIKRILENRSYLGEKGYPRIITDDIFDAVMVRKAENAYKGRHKSYEPVRERTVPLLKPYTPTAKILRITGGINRALERAPDPDVLMPQIYTCATEKYNSIGVTEHGCPCP